MAFEYRRTIRFSDTDAAGVMYFSVAFSICHEAYEASLGAMDVDLRHFFSREGPTIVPVVHAEADYLRPLYCGDEVVVVVKPRLLSENSFAVTYHWVKGSARKISICKAETQHVQIDSQKLQRTPLVAELRNWLQHWS